MERSKRYLEVNYDRIKKYTEEEVDTKDLSLIYKLFKISLSRNHDCDCYDDDCDCPLPKDVSIYISYNDYKIICLTETSLDRLLDVLVEFYKNPIKQICVCGKLCFKNRHNEEKYCEDCYINRFERTEEEGNCAICLENDGVWIELPCKHQFHKYCLRNIKKWECPLCRAEFKYYEIEHI
jgi:hypothetical protein